MRYIERILQPGEKVIYAGRLHWVIYLPAMIMLALALAALTQAGQGRTGMSWSIAAIGFAARRRCDVLVAPGSAAGPPRST